MVPDIVVRQQLRNDEESGRRKTNIPQAANKVITILAEGHWAGVVQGPCSPQAGQGLDISQ